MLEDIFVNLFWVLDDAGLCLINPDTGWANTYDRVICAIHPNPFEDAINAEAACALSRLGKYANSIERSIEDVWSEVVFEAAKEYREEPGIPFYNDQKRAGLVLHHIKTSCQLYMSRISMEDTDFADEELADMSILYPDWKVAD